MIDNATVEEIKYRNDIEDVISQYVTLKRAGSNLVGLCPFHSEKSPSFTVFPSSRNFYCFGCGAGGDVITFVMKAENLDYPSALEFLAKRAGIVIEERQSSDGKIKKSRIIDMNREAAKFFHANLLASDEAKEYLFKRNLGMPLIKHFGLGYAPADFGLLTDYLRKKGYNADEMKAGFLCGIGKTGHPYDYFRGRIMFPIIDISGDVIAFGGRVTDNSVPKYLNTSDTPAFKKSRNLFALNFAKNACSESLILCEGYMDVIALHGAGFTNAVATLGTALTSEQARIMKRYTKKVIISYDADDAGQRAADRAFGLLSEAGLETRILKVTDAKDPDEFIKKFGADRFRRLLDGSRTRFDFKFDNILAKYDISSGEGKIKACADAVDVISSVYSAVERDVYARNVSEKLEIPYEKINADIERAIRRKTAAAKKDREQKVIHATEGYGDRVNPDKIKNIAAVGAEEAIIGILAAYPELMVELEKKGVKLAGEDFFSEFDARVFDAMSKLGKEFDICHLSADFTPEEIGRITKMQVARNGLKNDISVLCDCIEKLKIEKERMSDSIEDLLKRKRGGSGRK